MVKPSFVYSVGGRTYEYLTWLLTLGRVDRFKRQAIEELGVKPGDHVLDWGCGTGISTQLVLPYLQGRGVVHGIDVSPGASRPVIFKNSIARWKDSACSYFSARVRHSTIN